MLQIEEPGDFEPVGAGGLVFAHLVLLILEGLAVVGIGLAEIRVGLPGGEETVDVDAIVAGQLVGVTIERIAVVLHDAELDVEVLGEAVINPVGLHVEIAVDRGVGRPEEEILGNARAEIGQIRAPFPRDLVTQADRGVLVAAVIEEAVGAEIPYLVVLRRADLGEAEVGEVRDRGVVGVHGGAVPARGLLGVGAAVGDVFLGVALHLGAELGVVRDLVGERDGEAVLLVARAVLIGLDVLVEEIHANGDALQAVVGVQRRAITAEAVNARAHGRGPVPFAEAGLLAGAALQAAGAAVAEQRGVGAAGEIVALGIVGVGHVVVDGAVAHGEIAVAIDAAETRLETIAAEGARFTASGCVRADGPSQGLVHVREVEVLEEFLCHHGNRGRRDAQRRVGAAAGEGVAAEVAAVFFRAHLEGREQDGVAGGGRVGGGRSGRGSLGAEHGRGGDRAERS